MTTRELAKILRENYTRPPSGRKTVEIHLFGIRFAQQLRQVSILEVVEASGIPATYATEIAKGVALAEFVTPVV